MNVHSLHGSGMGGHEIKVREIALSDPMDWTHISVYSLYEVICISMYFSVL